MTELTHLDEQGAARMVDVSEKNVSSRRAVAQAVVRLSAAAYDALYRGTLKKGDALATARIAGITGAKKTSDLIPLCHPLPISGITVDFEMNDEERTVRIITSVVISAQTGVEMEALTAAATAALTIYDMCKGVDKEIIIEHICLLSKSGGRSGEYTRTKGREAGGNRPDSGRE